MNKYLKEKEVVHTQKLHLYDITLAVDECARCHGEHPEVKAHIFKHPMRKSGVYGTSFDYWFQCPLRKEPVVFTLTVEAMESSWIETTHVFCCICRDYEETEVVDLSCGCKCHEDEE